MDTLGFVRAQKDHTENLPSAVQFRMGGCKGVLVVDPKLGQEDKIVIRPSMEKFKSDYCRLETISFSKPQPLFLNNQIVTLLSQLGLPGSAFFALYNDEIRPFIFAFFEPVEALKLIKFQHWHLTEIVYNFPYLLNESFAIDILKDMLTEKLEKLKTTQRRQIKIPMDKGRNMLGVMDETGKLEEGQVHVQYTCKESNQFVTHRGPVMVSKMPALHPGDVRKLQAVAVPGLEHLHDVIVFPQKGKRPHPNEMAGSDLDGDLYFVTWHEELILKKDNEEPMHFPSAAGVCLDRPITESDIIQHLKFIVENDDKGRISRQHLAIADEEGIASSKCLQVADLSAKMFDAPKTGVVPKWPINLTTKKAPDFMEKSDHCESYESKRVLGRLYRHSKLMLETVAYLSHCKSTWMLEVNNNANNDDDRDCSSINGDSVAEMANLLQESYAKVMCNLSEIHNIPEEIKIWRARFLDFRHTEEEKQKRKSLTDDLRNLRQTMKGLYQSAVRQLQQRGMRACIRRQLYLQCKRLKKEPFCTGFTLMLYSMLQKEKHDVEEDYYVYREIGRKVLQSLTPASKCCLLAADFIRLLLDNCQVVTVYVPVLLNYDWILASACFLVEHLCHSENDNILSWSRKLDCIIRVVLHASIRMELCSAADVIRAKDSVGYSMTFLVRYKDIFGTLTIFELARRLIKQLDGFLSSTDRDDFLHVGKTTVYGLWDIYTKREMSRTDGYDSWERELQGDAMALLLKMAFKNDFDTPTPKVDSRE